MAITAAFTIERVSDQCRCPPTDIVKALVLTDCNGLLLSYGKMKWGGSGKWIDVEGIILNKVTQIEKDHVSPSHVAPNL